MNLSPQKSGARILVIGYGNPHRQDDRVGHDTAEAIQSWAEENTLAGIRVITAYQLDLDMVEDAIHADIVIFIDAHIPEFSEHVSFTPVEPGDSAGFTTHAFTAGDIIALCNSLYGKSPQAFILSIPGYEFDMIDTLSPRTQELLPQAIDLLKARIEELLDR
jgi:hydrogenase maturation protease